MTAKQFKSLMLNVNFEVPASIEEFDQNAKKPGACLEEAINNVVYRGCLAEFRSLFCEELEQESGIARKTRETGKTRDVKTINPDGTETTSKEAIVVFDETESDYVKRVAAEKNVEVSTFQPLADKVAKNIVFDASAPERKPIEPKTLPKVYRTAAEGIFKNGNQTKWAEVFGITLSGDMAKDVEAVGWGIKRREDAKRQAELEQTYV